MREHMVDKVSVEHRRRGAQGKFKVAYESNSGDTTLS